ncbi:hypothetical protein RBWH47_04111 [Rhodopirellula baltica WH47]|uniref:Uncharacterized protein n=1 Tax=Rhodopirellula baltica WH47 TaxID=991778 RepID=F2ATA6_RHOBT|nr:hypothetical protein RBWH47_04111 [Rhodopirellula baltica WH47]
MISFRLTVKCSPVFFGWARGFHMENALLVGRLLYSGSDDFLSTASRTCRLNLAA